MKKNKKRLLLYTTSILLVTSGISLKINKEKSKELTNHVNEYTTDFIDDDFQIAAHRGFSSLEIENTKEAVTLASKKDYVDYIEIDARLTKDKKLVISHDDTITTIDESLKISELNKNELLKYTLTYNKNKLSIKPSTYLSGENKLIQERNELLSNKTYNIQTLKEALKYVENKKVILDLKIPNNEIEEFVYELKKELKDINTDNIMFQSSNLNGILYVEKYTNYNCLAIINSVDDLSKINNFKNICIRKNLINYDTVQKLINENKKVAIWTINTKKELNDVTNELDDLYEDVIYITDYPDLIATYLNDTKKNKILTKK
jgi:glycerophosphoryl diester phosphodiesterase